MTLKEIGQRIGLTRERVRQIEHEALDKLRRTMNPGEEE
jgi:DNA-directed RNA polymerase sigma subunit (sigma70/sigma32)